MAQDLSKKRDEQRAQIAAACLQGLLASEAAYLDSNGNVSPNITMPVVATALQLADALIAQLDQ